MAKQGINPIEQHVEKIVVGLSVLLFAFVVFNYVISTPVLVSVSGQMIPPGELDRKLGEIAQTVADAYKRASWVPPPITANEGAAGALKDIQDAKDLLAKVQPPMVSPMRWGPELPSPPKTPGGSEGRHGLATVSAPTVNGVFSGVTYAGLVAQPAALAEPGAGNAIAAAATTNQDLVWTFIRLNFDIQQQYDILRQNNYSREQANLILFLDVQAQRQRVYPDGATGPWEDVKTYKTVQASYPQTVQVGPDGSLGYGDQQTMKSLFASVAAEQQKILYPLPTMAAGDPFPPYYANGVPPTPVEMGSTPGIPPPKPVAPVRPAAARPTGRAEMRGGGGDMRGGGGGGGGGDMRGGASAARPTTPAAPSVDRAALLAANQALQEAKKAYDEKRYAEAKQILEHIQGGPTVQRTVTDLQQKVNAAYTKWQENEERVAAKKATNEARNAEIWVYDPQAPAGRTYRYRARVLLLNIYAYPDSDRGGELKEPQKGGDVALVGAWSAPSEPITVADSHYFFFTGGTPEKEIATVDVFRFQQGRWFKDSLRSLSLGDSIGDVKPVNTAGGPVSVDYRTGSVVVDIGTDSGAMVGSDNKGSKIGIKRQASPVLVCMDSDGAIEPRWVAVDRLNPLYKELEAKVKAAAEPTVSPTAATALPH